MIGYSYQAMQSCNGTRNAWEGKIMSYGIYYKPGKHCLLAICSTMESAQRWIVNFNPLIWDNKNMKRDELEIREMEY